MNLEIDVERLTLAHKAVRAELLAERSAAGNWVGQLGSSPFATAAAVSALVTAHQRDSQNALQESVTGDRQVIEQVVQGDLSELLVESVHWLARHQNPDGGWGDCDGARSNIAATMLVQAACRLTGIPAKYADLMVRADQYVAAEGGIAGLRRHCGADKTLLAAILANCALAGITPWRQVPTLQFELLCLPKRWQRDLQVFAARDETPLVLAVGRAKFHYDPPKNPISRLIRRSMRAKSLAILERLQAADDSFLASTPLTAFVVMCLSGIGCQEHRIVRRGIEFLLTSVRADSSWSITPSLAVSNTALALNNLSNSTVVDAEKEQIAHNVGGQSDLPDDSASNGKMWAETASATDTLIDHSSGKMVGQSSHHSEHVTDEEDSLAISDGCLDWLLANQRAEPNPLTEVPAGGWASSDAAGALPNTIAAANVLLALARLHRDNANVQQENVERAVRRGIVWLVNLQNENGSWPTYYRDDDSQRFDEIGTDATSQVLSALAAWRRRWQSVGHSQPQRRRADVDERIASAIDSGWQYLELQQRSDGSFIPRWFGNEHQPDEHNPVYGTAQVLFASAALGRLKWELVQRALRWLVAAQHTNGGWGPPRARLDYSGAEKDGFRARRDNEAMAKFCTVEETSLAVSALLPVADSDPTYSQAASRGLTWLINAVEQDGHRQPAIVGFSLPKLWYHERLYPLVFAAGALSQAVRELAPVTPAVSHVG